MRPRRRVGDGDAHAQERKRSHQPDGTISIVSLHEHDLSSYDDAILKARRGSERGNPCGIFWPCGRSKTRMKKALQVIACVVVCKSVFAAPARVENIEFLSRGTTLSG